MNVSSLRWRANASDAMPFLALLRCRSAQQNLVSIDESTARWGDLRFNRRLGLRKSLVEVLR
eukprot:1674249-Rhodomonas_salina.1